MYHFLPWYYLTTVVKHFLPWYHFTTVLWLFPPWYHFTTLIAFYYRDGTFCTLISVWSKNIRGAGGGEEAASRAPPLDPPLFILLPWCDILYLDIITCTPWWNILYLDNDFSTVMYQTLRLLCGAFLYCFCSTVIRICLYCQAVPRLFTYRYLVFLISRLSTSRMKIKVLTARARAGVWREKGKGKRENRLACSRAPRSLLLGVLVDFWKDKRKKKSVYRLRCSFF